MLTPNLEDVKKTLERYPFPVDVIVEVIANCNLKCVMCPQPELQRPRGEMSFETFKKIADEVAEKGPDSRMWLAIMGEPLMLGPRLIKMIKYAKGAGVSRVNLNTNAVLMKPDLGDLLLDSGVDEILVGMDALTEATYDKIRVGGDFLQVNRNINHLLALLRSRPGKGPKLVMQFIVMDENEHEMEAFKEFWLSRGVVVKIRPKLGWGTGVEAANLSLPQSERTFPCPWLTRTVSIHWSGRIAQCDADFEAGYSPGDLAEETIESVWQGELAQRRERHWAGDFSHELCRECNDWQAGRSQFFYPEEAIN